MIPIVTPARMAAIDAAAPEPVDVLIERAGAAVACAAAEAMGGCYGRRVIVLAGPGNNGADGRSAAGRLRRAGVRAVVVPVADAPAVLAAADLYIDAAFGTGLSRPYAPPQRARPQAPVLAVDIPSGIDGLTGEVLGGPVWTAQRTVTFAALKPGLLLGAGPATCGEVTVADIGLAVADDDHDACALLTDADIDALPAGTGATHKWHAGVLVVAGSPGMGGAAALACEAALRSGARIVHLSAPGGPGVVAPVEVVRTEPPLACDVGRFAVCAAGPGLGTSASAADRLADALALGLPTVIDADGLRLLRDPTVAEALARHRRSSTPLVLTPHDGELEALVGSRPGADRIAAARGAASQLQAVVLLKGGPTVVASHDGRVRIVSSGDARLATAGSGDVLTGIIAGRLAASGTSALVDRVLAASGTSALVDRVAEAAHLHGRAAAAVSGSRIIARDLLAALQAVTP